MTLPSRDDAWNLLCEYTETDSLRNHARAVEQVMRAAARF
jgi:predicted hydrolase (HD superfamily)